MLLLSSPPPLLLVGVGARVKFSTSSSLSLLMPGLSSTPNNKRKRAWVDPESLSSADILQLDYHDASLITGNVPLRVKQLVLNTYASYGVGEGGAFGHESGRRVRFVSMDVEWSQNAEGVEVPRSVTLEAELVVSKSK